MNSKMIFAMLLAFGVAFAGLSVDAYTVSKTQYEPNEPGIVTVTVSNPIGSERVTSITMSIENPPEIAVTSAPKMSDIDAGGTAIVSIPFRVRDDARPGIYLLNVVFSGYKQSGGTSLATVNTVSVPITVVKEPDLSISVDDSVLSGIDDVVLTVSNNGGPAKNLKLSASGPVSISGSDVLYIGELAGNSSKSLEITLDSRGAADGPTDVAFIFEYQDELGMGGLDNSTLRMTVRNEKLDLKFDQTSAIITKMESNLTFTVRNEGAEPLKDVRLSFPDDALRLKDSGEMKFGNLAPGQSASASVVAFAELPPGVNPVNAEISYIERDVQKLEARQLPITITSDADVGVYLEAKPLPLTLGSEHTISVLVSNLGSYRIDNVDVSLQSPAFRSMDISEKQYIGSLQNDDFSTVQFLMAVNATSEGSAPVKVTINYRDQSGEWKSKTVTQNVNVYSPPAADGSPLPIVGGIVVLAIAVWFLFLRKKNTNGG
ncbi:hypothetical protein L0Y65_05995 [Candidatus Micrarchaeota archaeon]|nr:hypothetical protein [Candidatus Micrarchaeota archaeon]